MAIDPFDEFEFKPLTEGLGFHKKPKVDFALSSMGADIISEPRLPKGPAYDKKPSIPKAPTTSNMNASQRSSTSVEKNISTNVAPSTTVDEILKTLSERKKYDFAEDLKLTQPKDNLIKPSHFELAASMLDGMLIIASFLSSLIILLLITKVDLFGNLLSPDEDRMIYFGLMGLFAGLCWIYLVVNRIFLGFTPGEWVFDQRIGHYEQLGSAGYSMRIAIRSAIVIATGLVTFPIISMITRKDLLGKFLNVQTMKKA